MSCTLNSNSESASGKPNLQKEWRGGSTHAQTSTLGHWGNRPEQEPGQAHVSCRSPTCYHSRGDLEQLSTQHRIWHTKIFFLAENILASLLQFLPDNGSGLGEIPLRPYVPKMGVTVMVAGNRLS